jgi:hypothetical protein
MKFFVSGKIGSNQDVNQLMNVLKAAGHEITFDWTAIEHLRPYDTNAKASREAALLEARGVKSADVLIVIAHDRGVGLFVEMGIAIGAGIPVRVITNKESRTMFFHHPLIKRVTDINQIINEFC